MPQQNSPLLIADSDVVLVVAPQKQFRQLRVSYKNWADPQIFKEGETLELSWTTQGAVAHRGGAVAHEIPVSRKMREAGAGMILPELSDLFGDQAITLQVVEIQDLAEKVYAAMRAAALSP